MRIHARSCKNTCQEWNPSLLMSIIMNHLLTGRVAHNHCLGVSRSSPVVVGTCQPPFSDSCINNTIIYQNLLEIPCFDTKDYRNCTLQVEHLTWITIEYGGGMCRAIPDRDTESRTCKIFKERWVSIMHGIINSTTNYSRTCFYWWTSISHSPEWVQTGHSELQVNFGTICSVFYGIHVLVYINFSSRLKKCEGKML